MGLITRSYLRELHHQPKLASPTVDEKGRLRVGAAVGTRDSDRDRVRHLYQAQVDVVAIDSSQGNSVYQLEMLKFIKETCPGEAPFEEKSESGQVWKWCVAMW